MALKLRCGIIACFVVLIISQAISAKAHSRPHPKSFLRIEDLRFEMDPGVNITSNVTEFHTQGERALVRWEGVQAPSDEDFIALFAPANATLWRKLPVHFMSCAVLDKAYLETGAGSAVFKLLNLRTTYRFALLRGGVVRPTLVAQSEPIMNRVAAHPTGVHLALYQDHRSVVVQWVSAFSQPQQAQWTLMSAAPAGNHTWRYTASSDAITYNASQMCGYPANTTGWLHPGYQHSALLPARTLQPGQRYLYRVGMDNVGWSQAYSFIAPLGPGVEALQHAGLALRAPDVATTNSTAADATAVDSAAVAAVPVYESISPGSMATSSSRRALAHPASALQQTHQQQQQQQQDQQARQQAGVVLPARPQQQKEQEEEEEAGVFKFLAMNDVAMTDPLLFNDPGAGLGFAEKYGENSTWLSTWLGERGQDSDAHLAILVGDLAYAMGYASDWDVWLEQFQAAFSRWPLMVGTGNHERDWPGTGDAFNNTARDSGGECNVPFAYRFSIPTEAPQPDPRTSYYSFNQGPVHFLILDSETPSDPASPQGQFVARDLAQVNRTATPWVVAAVHRMMVAPATWRRRWVGDVDVEERLQRDHEELFREHQVDVVIQGHEHAYSRTCPLYKLQCVGESSGSSSSSGSGSAPGGNGAQEATRLRPARDTCPSKATDLLSWLLRPKCWLRGIGSSPAASCSSSGSPSSSPAARGHQRGAPVKEGGSSKAPRHLFQAPAGGPVYILAGHAGAGFTHGFPEVLPDWVEVGIQDQNGYLRFTATGTKLRMEAVASRDGALMDFMELHR